MERYEYVYERGIRSSAVAGKNEEILRVSADNDYVAFLLHQRYFSIPAAGRICVTMLDEFVPVPREFKPYFPSADCIQLTELSINDDIYESVYVVRYDNPTNYHMCPLCGSFPRESELHNTIMIPTHIGISLHKICRPRTAKIISRTLAGRQAVD